MKAQKEKNKRQTDANLEGAMSVDPYKSRQLISILISHTSCTMKP